jgi:transposase
MTEGVITVSKQEAYKHRVISEFVTGKLKRSEAAKLLGVRERSVSRLAHRFREKGLLGIKHGNCTRRPVNRTVDAFREQVLDIVRRQYFDFNLTHCQEKLKQGHGIEVKRETFRKWCHSAGLVKQRHKRRPVARRYRERMPAEGMLLQLDGSPHRWNGEDVWTLIAAIDDATSRIPHAEFFPSEDTLNCMRVLQRIIEKTGIPECLYVDKAGIFGGSKRQLFSQFARACDELGIRILFANSAQAKGRIERTFRTLQDRLIPEMRIRKIHRMPRANEFLQEEFIPGYWESANTCIAQNPDRRYRTSPRLELDEILCLKEWRAIAADQTISLDNKRMLIDIPCRYSLRGQKVELRTYQDCTRRVFFSGAPVELIPIELPLRKLA